MSVLAKYKPDMLVEFDFTFGTSNDLTGNGGDLSLTLMGIIERYNQRVMASTLSGSIGSFASVQPGQEMTIICMGTCDEPTGADNVMFGAGAGDNLAQFDINDNDSMRLYLNGTLPASVEVPLTTADIIGKETFYGVVRESGTTEFFLNGSSLGSVSQPGTSNAEFGLIGNIIAGSKPWLGTFSYMVIIDAALTPEEIAGAYEELKTRVPYNLVDVKSVGNYINQCVDGDMDKAGTDDWTPGNDAALSKVDGLSGNALRIAYTGPTQNPIARQYNTIIGETYRIRGIARGDGTFAPMVGTGGVTLWTGTTSTDWQEFDEVFEAGDTDIRLRAVALSAGYADFDNVELFACEADGTPKYMQSYIADGKGWNEGESVSGYLKNTGWKIGAGSPEVVSEGDETKSILISSPGLLGIPCSQVYGTWEFELYKDSDVSQPYVSFFSDSIQAIFNPVGYQFVVGSTELALLRRIDGGSATTLVTTGSGYFPIGEWTPIKVTRKTNGEWELFIDDVSIGTATDATYTSGANYCVLNSNGDDRVRNFKFIPYIR